MIQKLSPLLFFNFYFFSVFIESKKKPLIKKTMTPTIMKKLLKDTPKGVISKKLAKYNPTARKDPKIIPVKIIFKGFFMITNQLLMNHHRI